MLDAVAQRYGVLPFNRELIESWKSPYRRACLVALLEEETDERIILKFLKKDLPKIMKDLTDALGVSIYAASPKKWNTTIRSIFKRRELYKPQDFDKSEPGEGNK